MKRKINRICVIDSAYALLQYLLLSSENDILHTYFFWGNGISPEMKKYFEGMNTTMPTMKYRPIIKTLLYHLIAPIAWPFVLKDKFEYWGQDHLHFGAAILRKHKFHLLEDGVLNYNPRPQYKKLIKIRKMFMGELGLSTWQYAGEESTCEWIHLTKIKDSPILDNPKVIINKFKDLWDFSSEGKRILIEKIFGLTPQFLHSLHDVKKIILTEPLSEDNVLTETEKIELYGKILAAIGTKDILIKPHPREKTDYKKYFPNYPVLKLRVPLELLSLVGIQFEEAYSLFSTALYTFPYPIKVCFIGCEVHPKLMKEYPNATSDNFISSCNGINLIKLNLS